MKLNQKLALYILLCEKILQFNYYYYFVIRKQLGNYIYMALCNILF